MRCLSLWRTWIRQLIMSIYSLLLLVAIILIAIDLDKHKADTHVWGWFVGGLFVLFSLPISLWGILQHVIHYTKPYLQRREIRIMWMVPIYATDAVSEHQSFPSLREGLSVCESVRVSTFDSLVLVFSTSGSCKRSSSPFSLRAAEFRRVKCKLSA